MRKYLLLIVGLLSVSTLTYGQSNCSVGTDRQVNATFINRAGVVVYLEELEFDCQPIRRATLQPYESYTITSYEGADWRFMLDEQSLGIVSVPNRDSFPFDILPPPSSVSTADVFKLSYGTLMDRELAGTYTKISDTTWLEENIARTDGTQWTEVNRDEDAVYLMDDSQQLRQLNLSDAMIYSISDDGTTRDPIGIIYSAWDEQLNASNLTYANYRDDETNLSIAYVEEVGDGVWVHQGFEAGATSYLLDEVRHDATTLYLYDVTQDMTIAVDVENGSVTYDNLPDKQYTIFEAGGPIITPLINGYNMTFVAVGNTVGNQLGYYQQLDAVTWVDNNGIAFDLVGRDEWSVYLYDMSQNMTLRLDLWLDGVFTQDDGNQIYVTFDEWG